MKPLEQICNLGFELCGSWTRGDDGTLKLYRRPHASQTTNVRVNSLILDQLETIPVHIYVWACDGLMTYGGFRLDLAAGLEDSIVRDITPEWNIRK